MRQLLALIAIALFGYMLWPMVPFITSGELGEISRHYVEHGLQDNRGANLVTSVVVNYRGFDTLGEIVVLFLSVTGVVFLLRRKTGLDLAPQKPASELVKTGARLLFGPILLFGAYIFVHGHLTPGGGFQGGAVVASAVMLLLLADHDRALNHTFLSWMESPLLSSVFLASAPLALFWPTKASFPWVSGTSFSLPALFP